MALFFNCFHPAFPEQSSQKAVLAGMGNLVPFHAAKDQVVLSWAQTYKGRKLS
jgi:hypothetical protein